MLCYFMLCYVMLCYVCMYVCLCPFLIVQFTLSKTCSCQVLLQSPCGEEPIALRRRVAVPDLQPFGTRAVPWHWSSSASCCGWAGLAGLDWKICPKKNGTRPNVDIGRFGCMLLFGHLGVDLSTINAGVTKPWVEKRLQLKLFSSRV